MEEIELHKNEVEMQNLPNLEQKQSLAFEILMQKLQSQYEKFKSIERHLQSEKIRLTQKIPEIKKSLRALKLLEENEEKGKTTELKYALGDCAYANGVMEPENAKKVYLWLGANVMLEYEREDAVGVLERNLENCERSKTQNEKDLEFLKDNVTIQEVTLARIYNWDVKRRQKQRDATVANVANSRETGLEQV